MVKQVDEIFFEQNPNYCLDSIIYGDWSDFSTEMNISCNYISEQNAVTELKSIENSLSIFSLNTQSLFAKHTDLSCFLYQFNRQNIYPSIIALQETWITDHININHLQLDGYNWIGNHRKNQRGGGVGCYIHKDFKFEEVFNDFFLEGIHESMCLKVTQNNLKFYILNLYRPPHESNEKLEQFFDIFSNLMNLLSELNVPTFVCGDINLNLFETTCSTSAATRFVDIMTFNGYLNTTLRATRITPQTFSLIDVFFMKNYCANHSKSFVVLSDISDHYPILNIFKTKLKKTSLKLDDYEKRIINEENLLSLNEALHEQNWDDIINATDVNIAYNSFLTKFLKLYDTHCPKKTFKPNKKTTPTQKYTNDHLLNCRNFKHYLYSKQHKEKTDESINTYKRYRNELRRSFKRAKQSYFQTEIRKAGTDSRKIWKTLREAMHIEKKNEITDHLIINGRKISEPTEIANHFNFYFTTLGTSLIDQIPLTNRSFLDYLPNRINETIFIRPLDELTTFNTITSCFPKTSTDANEISMKTIVNCAAPLSVPLNSIFNLSISTAKFPEGMKTSKCITLFKGGDMSVPDNYRCLSLISNFSKPLEKIMYNNIYSFLDERGFFSKRQFGFRKSISTMHNLLDLSNLIANTQAEGKVCSSVLIDIKKCFDTIDRSILFRKLEHYGIRGKTLEWIKSYFSNRKQFIFFKGKMSSLRDILLGILQGSVLGPLLFSIFINDIENAVANAIFNLFADDSITFLVNDNIPALIQTLQETLPHIVDWYSANRLIINSKKTKIILFTTPRQTFSEEKIQLKINFPVFINTNSFGQHDPNKITKLSLISNNSENKDDRHARHLGIELDEKMNFKFHFDNLHRRLQKACFSLKLMKNILDKKHLKILYSSYCKSLLEYGIIIFTGVSNETLKPIRVLQKSCIRIIAKTSNNRAHTTPLFKQYRILPYNELMTYNICKFMFKYKHGLAPEVFNDCWQFNHNIHNYPTRNNHDFSTRTNINQFIMNTPLFKFPRIFNSLPANIKNILNEKLFQRKLFNYLLNNIQ